LEKIKEIFMKSIFVILIISILLLLGCNETDKQKKELVMKIMENPDKLDSLVKSSVFFEENFYNLYYNKDYRRTVELIDYIKKYRIHGYYLAGAKKLSVSNFKTNEEDFYNYILIAFENQKIGILFSFRFDEDTDRWVFDGLSAFGNTLDGI
jgi:hypothetical protein